MRRLRGALARIAATLAIVLSASVVHAQDEIGAWRGTWQVNVARSTYPSGPPAFKRMTCTIESWEDGLRVAYDIVGDRGGITHTEWVGKFDGRDYRVAGIDGYTVTHAYRRVDERTYDVIQKTEGEATLTARMVVSADGQTLTTFTPGERVPGGPPITVTVFDKRPR